MKRNMMMVLLVALMTGACGQSGAGNLQQAGATADANLATVGAQAGDAASAVEAKINERLVARVWQWGETTTPSGGSTKPSDPSVYTVTFVPGGTVAVKADCKVAGGTYTADDVAMRFTVKVSTTEACAAGSMADTFIEQLGQVDTWAVDGNALALALANNAGTMFFNAP